MQSRESPETQVGANPPPPDPTQAEADALMEQVLGVTDAPEPATAPPVNVDVPYVSGTGTVGSTLNCTMGNWDNMFAEPHSYAYAWSGAGAGTAESYVVVAADAGTSVTCTVTATNAAGSVAAPPSNAIAIA